MPRPSLAVVPLAAVLAVAFAQPSPAKAPSAFPATCDAKRQHVRVLGKKRTRLKHPVAYLTVAATEDVRVYRSTRNYVEDRFYVCDQSTGRARFIGRALRLGGASSQADGLDEFSIRSDIDGTRTYVAFRKFLHGDVNTEQFIVVDASGRRMHDTGRLAENDLLDVRNHDVLALTPSGAIAYEHLGVLVARDKHGSRVLAAPAGGVVDNVIAAGQTVFWTQGGVAHSALLT